MTKIIFFLISIALLFNALDMVIFICLIIQSKILAENVGTCKKNPSNEYPQYVFVEIEEKWVSTYKMACAPSKDTDQPGHQMPRLIFAGCTCHFADFVISWLKYFADTASYLELM